MIFLEVWDDLMNSRCRKNDCNSGVQLQPSNFSTLYAVIYLDLRAVKESVAGDLNHLILHYRLNETANAHDYTIFTAVPNEKEMVIKDIGDELFLV